MLYRPVVKVQLEKDGVFIMGRGRAQLLKLIDEKKSILKAAEDMKMSYRHAWGILKKINEALGTDVVESSRGSVGGSSLTPAGRKLLEDYGELVEKINNCIGC